MGVTKASHAPGTSVVALEKLGRDRPVGVCVVPQVPCLYLCDQDIVKGSALQERGDNPWGLS